jgi:hypothetical protein
VQTSNKAGERTRAFIDPESISINSISLGLFASARHACSDAEHDGLHGREKVIATQPLSSDSPLDADKSDKLVSVCKFNLIRMGRINFMLSSRTGGGRLIYFLST